MTDRPRLKGESGIRERFDRAVKNSLATQPKPRKPYEESGAKIEKAGSNNAEAS